MIRRAAYNRNQNIGVFSRANDHMALVPKNSTRGFSKTVEEALQVKVYRMSICGTSLLGTMITMNDHGIVLPRNAYAEEIGNFKKMDVKVGVLDDRLTALGNLMLANDNGAVVSPRFSATSARVIGDVLDVEVERGEVGGFRTIGSVGIATNKGALLHPMVDEEDVSRVEDVLKVEVDVGTVNRGVGFLRTGIIANAGGAVVGEDTTGPEIARIEDQLGLLE